MFCGNCGHELGPDDVVCPICATPRADVAPPTVDSNTYSRMARKSDPSISRPIRSWQDLTAVPMSATINKTVAGWICILLGAFGVHKLYMGDTKNGIIRLVLAGITAGAALAVTELIALVEGFRYLSMDPRQFYWDYDTRDCMYGRSEPKHWF